MSYFVSLAILPVLLTGIFGWSGILSLALRESAEEGALFNSTEPTNSGNMRIQQLRYGGGLEANVSIRVAVTGLLVLAV